MEKRNSGSLSSLTGMTPPGTPKTPTELEAEKEAEIKLQIQQLASERVRVQKKTFTKWMNSYLQQKNMKVENLFEDIKDGEYLLSLLEVLSGEKLEMKKGKLKNVHISNISTALSFLEQKKMELVNVNVSDIANGEPTIVFRLMWTIILYFQIEDTFAQTATGESGEQKFRMNAKKAVLTWTANAITKKYGIEITNFGKCWRDGLAFNALIDTINPDLVDFDQCRKHNARTNLEQAFYVAESLLGIPRLLDAEDVDVEKPDEKSVMTYVAQFVKAYPWAGLDPSIMATTRKLNDPSCGNMKVQDGDHPVVDSDYLDERKQDVDVEKPDDKSVMTYVAQCLNAYPKAGEDPSIMATTRKLNDPSCGNMKVQDGDHPVVDSDYLEERKQDVDVEKTDEKSVMTYVPQCLNAYPQAGEDPSIMATTRKLNDPSCGNMKVQDGDHPVVDSDYLDERKQDTSTVELGVESEIRIVLIGRTGAGKSATGNTILGNIHFDSKLSASSVTRKCRRGETIQAGKKVIVVDTPGLFDTGMANEMVINEIVKCIGITSPGPHAMVLVVGIGRFTKEEQDTVQHFVEKFGEGMLRYMIVLFTREDELSKSKQSIDQYVDSLPKELKAILHQCGNRYVAFNNDAVGQTQREQVSRFFGMVDSMQIHNDRSCYTNELYAEAEVTLQRRMRKQKKKLEKRKQQESDNITRQLEEKYAKELKIEKVALMNYDICMKNIQKKFSDVSNIQDRRELEKHIKSQQQLHAADDENIKTKNTRLQRVYDESKMRYEKEVRERVRNKEIKYESKMNSENLRKHERDDIENESGGVLVDIGNGFKRVCSSVVAGRRAVFNFFGF